MLKIYICIYNNSSGIGHFCALEFAKSKVASLTLTARRIDRLTALKTEIEAAYPSVKVHVAELDVRDRKKVDISVEYVLFI